MGKVLSPALSSNKHLLSTHVSLIRSNVLLFSVTFPCTDCSLSAHSHPSFYSTF